MNIGLCGGTFDPFHRGHLEPVLAIRDEMRWDRVIYIPAWRQPFKSGQPAASPYHRFAMAVLATQTYPFLYVSPLELERGGVSYTVDTLEELRRLSPDAAFDWIIGDDNVAELGGWKDLQRIVQLARFIVLSRDRGGQRPAGVPSDRILFSGNHTVPVSATEIRARVRAGASIDGLVDPLVSRYIQHCGLYKEATT